MGGYVDRHWAYIPVATILVPEKNKDQDDEKRMGGETPLAATTSRETYRNHVIKMLHS